MIPKEIATRLVHLKEKAKTYSSIQRSLDVSERRDEVNEIKAAVENANAAIADLAKKTDNILVSGMISNFEIDRWFEDLKDKTIFSEPNPRLVYEEEQRELERQRKLSEEKEKQEIERQRKLTEEAKQEIEKQRKLAEEKQSEVERQREIEKEREKRRQDEIERQKQVEEEKAKKEAEEHQKKLKAQRIEEFKKMCLYRFGEDINRLKELIDEGLNINEIEDFDCLESCISWNPNLPFIKYLVDSGAIVKSKHLESCNDKLNSLPPGFSFKKLAATTPILSLLEILENAKNKDSSAFEFIRKKKSNEKQQMIFGIIVLAIALIFFIVYFS